MGGMSVILRQGIFAAIILLLSVTLNSCWKGETVNPVASPTITPVTELNQVISDTPSPVLPDSSPTLDPVLDPVSETSPAPLPVYTPEATPFIPTGTQEELFQYLLDLINKDRQSAGSNPVALNHNAAAQEHAQDMLDNNYVAHWDTNGLKPYMRYTLQGGLNYEGENSARISGNKIVDPKKIVQELEQAMMYDDASSNGLHRDNIINPWHKKVSLGIAYDKYNLALVEQFEGDYIEYSQPPILQGNLLSISGRLLLEDMVLDNVSIAYDEWPQPLTGSQLTNGPYHTYSLGQWVGHIISPPPSGQVYTNLPSDVIPASKWEISTDGSFLIQATVDSFLKTGKGVYTIVLTALINGDAQNLTNYSLFIP